MFAIFDVTPGPRFEWSPPLIFFICVQLDLAVPIPKILDRTKQASFPMTLVLDSVKV
jgi:hypothetical protein